MYYCVRFEERLKFWKLWVFSLSKDKIKNKLIKKVNYCFKFKVKIFIYFLEVKLRF